MKMIKRCIKIISNKIYVKLPNEKGNEVALFLYEDGDVLLAWDSGDAILLTNE
jgi:hypothetical protein